MAVPSRGWVVVSVDAERSVAAKFSRARNVRKSRPRSPVTFLEAGIYISQVAFSTRSIPCQFEDKCQEIVDIDLDLQVSNQLRVCDQRAFLPRPASQSSFPERASHASFQHASSPIYLTHYTNANDFAYSYLVKLQDTTTVTVLYYTKRYHNSNRDTTILQPPEYHLHLLTSEHLHHTTTTRTTISAQDL